MLAFIASIRIYLYAAAVAAILGAGAWYTYHERNVEHKKDIATAVKEVDAVKVEDTKIVATATTEVQKDTSIYEATNAAPPVPDIGVVCKSTVRPAVPAPAPSATSGDSPSQPVPASVYDPSGDLLTVARQDAATIRDLQAEIAALRAEMEAANKAHK